VLGQLEVLVQALQCTYRLLRMCMDQGEVPYWLPITPEPRKYTSHLFTPFRCSRTIMASDVRRADVLSTSRRRHVTVNSACPWASPVWTSAPCSSSVLYIYT